MIKVHLLQYKSILKKVKKLEDRLLEIDSIISTKPNNIKDLISEIIQIKKLIYKALQEKYRLRIKIEQAINFLPQREQYLIRLRYLSAKAWKQISINMDYGVSQIHRLHLKSLALLDENVK